MKTKLWNINRNKTIARTFEKIGIVEGWGSGLKRIIQMCRTYGVESPQFIEIGDMIRVNFYRPTFQKTGDKTAINAETGDKTAINTESGDKTAIKDTDKIIAFLQEHTEAKSSEIAQLLNLKISRTRAILTSLVEDGVILPHGANKNRTYSLKK